ncbi:MAG: ferritin [Bacteroidetes bacterium]|nr:ferritin [Bacteroidota bacterium]
MISAKIEKELNKQIELEAEASYYYLSMASWCDQAGFNGAASFLYGHSEEERSHMLRLFSYINDAGGHALVPEVKAVPHTFKSLKSIFETVLKHEQDVTAAINNLVEVCLKEKDHSTTNFLQWYVAEQHEEEKLFRMVLDKFNIIGEDGKALFWIDKELESMSSEAHDSVTNQSK